MEGTIMVVWITKYALTDGIREIEAEISKTSQNMITHHASDSGRSWMMTHFHGNDWHRTKELAVERAEEMRQEALASAKKRITKLEGMTF
jgi:hypothetical protein